MTNPGPSALTDLILQGREHRNPAPEAPAEQPKPRRRPAPAAPATPTPAGEWSGAVPKAAIARRALNVGMPEVLGIHKRLAQLKADTGISAHDAAAEALDAWLTAKGYPRPEA